MDRRTAKFYLRSLPPVTATNLINSYRLPTPWREVLLCVCVHRKEGFAGIDYLSEHYKINLSYWTFVRRSKQALEMFHKIHSANI